MERARKDPSGTPPPAPAPSEPVREAITMALYVCIVLVAEFAAVPEDIEHESHVIGVIWGTTVGLALAHVFAFVLAARVLAGGRMWTASRTAIWSQLGAAAAVALVLTIPFIFFDVGTGMRTAAFLAASLIGVTAYLASRASRADRLRSFVSGAAALAIALAIVSLKVTFSRG